MDNVYSLDIFGHSLIDRVVMGLVKSGNCPFFVPFFPLGEPADAFEPFLM